MIYRRYKSRHEDAPMLPPKYTEGQLLEDGSIVCSYYIYHAKLVILITKSLDKTYNIFMAWKDSYKFDFDIRLSSVAMFSNIRSLDEVKVKIAEWFRLHESDNK